MAAGHAVRGAPASAGGGSRALQRHLGGAGIWRGRSVRFPARRPSGGQCRAGGKDVGQAAGGRAVARSGRGTGMLALHREGKRARGRGGEDPGAAPAAYDRADADAESSLVRAGRRGHQPQHASGVEGAGGNRTRADPGHPDGGIHGRLHESQKRPAAGPHHHAPRLSQTSDAGHRL